MASLAEEVKQVRYGSANDSLRAFLLKATATAEEHDADAQSMVPPLEPLLAAFLKALAPQAKEKAQRLLLVVFGTEISQALKDPSFGPEVAPHDWLLLCAFLALHRIGELTGESAARMLDAFGLMRPIVEAFAALPTSVAERPQTAIYSCCS